MADTHPTDVTQADILNLLRGYDPPRKLSHERDLLAGRYRIQMNQPLAELNSPFAKAYGATDEQSPQSSVYAMVFAADAPLRVKNIKALKTLRHANVVSLLESGLVDIQSLAETRYVVIIERPAGLSLAQWLTQKNTPMSETVLTNTVLRPLVSALCAFQRAGISHNRINPKNIYFSNQRILLGECISEPSGFSQEPIFEVIERLQALPLGKADYAITADCYALAVLAIHMLLGFSPFISLRKDTLISELMEKGAYHTFALPYDLPDDMQDFFRGILGDKKRDRWDPETTQNWLKGKRLNLIPPSPAREAARGFEFAGELYYNCKSLAHGLFRKWNEARSVLFSNKLARWTENGAHKPDAADAIARICINAAPDNAHSERHNNDLLSRIITVLDPTGPLRFKHISTSIDKIGALLSHALLENKQDDIQCLLEIIESDLPVFYIDQQKKPRRKCCRKKTGAHTWFKPHSHSGFRQRTLYI